MRPFVTITHAILILNHCLPAYSFQTIPSHRLNGIHRLPETRIPSLSVSKFEPPKQRQTDVDNDDPSDNSMNDPPVRSEATANRRTFVSYIASTLALAGFSPQIASSSTASPPPSSPELSWPLGKVAFSLLPLAGSYTRRATVEETIVPDVIWTHDQIQGVVGVNVPVRQTVIRLSEKAGGGLLVHNPVAPTGQLLGMMRRLEEKYGKVRHVVLGTVALEHKATFGAFASHFPESTVWIQPGQWSFPVNLPIEFEGVTQRGRRLREIPLPNTTLTTTSRYQYYNNLNPIPEWTADIDYETLGPFKFKAVGEFSETAFFHKATKTLLVTDTVVSVTDDPPPIIQEDPRALLFHARDDIDELVPDTLENRKKGWRRMVQFGLVFFPSKINVTPTSQALREARNLPEENKKLGEGLVPFNLYPWTWDKDMDKVNFNAISNGGKLFCPPILTKLILDREPTATLRWVNRVCDRFPNIRRVVPGHLNNNVRIKSNDEFRDAFRVLSANVGKTKNMGTLAEDLALLQQASDLLTRVGVVESSKVCDGEPARGVSLTRRFR